MDNSSFYNTLAKKWSLEDFPMTTWAQQPLTFKGTFVHNWFSNFAETPITIRGVTAPTVEHYYQSQKTIKPLEQDLVLTCHTPGQAKRAGRHITLRSDWEYIKFDVMYQALLAKCMAYPEFLAGLRKCEDIVEWNNWRDQIWGATLDGVGRNALGIQLMYLRDNL